MEKNSIQDEDEIQFGLVAYALRLYSPSNSVFITSAFFYFFILFILTLCLSVKMIRALTELCHDSYVSQYGRITVSSGC